MERVTSFLQNNWGKIALTTAGGVWGLSKLFGGSSNSASGSYVQSNSSSSKIGSWKWVPLYPNKEIFMKEDGPFQQFVTNIGTLVNKEGELNTERNRRGFKTLQACETALKKIDWTIAPKEARALEPALKKVVENLQEARIPGVQQKEHTAKTAAGETFFYKEKAITREITKWGTSLSQDDVYALTEQYLGFRKSLVNVKSDLATVGGVHSHLKDKLSTMEAAIPALKKLEGTYKEKHKDDKKADAFTAPTCIIDLLNANRVGLLKSFKDIKKAEKMLDFKMTETLDKEALTLFKKVQELHKSLTPAPKEEEKEKGDEGKKKLKG